MNLANFIVQSGLAHRAAQDYDREQAQDAYLQRLRQHGIRKMEAEEALMGENTELAKLRQQVERTELEFKQRSAPKRQAIEETKLEGEAERLPIEQETATTEAKVKRATAKTQEKLLPGQAKIAQATQDTQLQELQERQTANLWTLIKMGDPQGALEALNKSELLFPGRQFSRIVRGSVPVPGEGGKPMVGADGQPVREEVLRLEPADGGDPVFVPVKALEALATKYSTRLEKVGDAIVRLGPGGSVTPVYTQDEFAATDEGAIYSKRTGEVKASAVASGGLGSKAGQRTAKFYDERVKMAISNVILPRYGGRFEGGMFFPDEANKDVATRAVAIAGQLIRSGMEPEQAGVEAIARAEREKAVKEVGGASGYSGPTPWKR
ncbi:MAG: hypothetical protein AB1830_13250 [Pseudomonadota bacterium]